MKQSSSYIAGHGIQVGKEACPMCRANGKDRAGDNLHRYEDGHAWCFSCSYREPSTATAMLERAFKAIEKVSYSDPNVDIPKDEPKGVYLPEDAGKSIAAYALQWLSKYGIMREEIIQHDIRWSDMRKQLIFPIRGAGSELLAFVARGFNKDAPKWRTYGEVRSIVHILFPKPVVIGIEEPLVVVEDIVSAIKVGRSTCAVPLFGSHVNPEKLLRMRHMTKKIIFWLDGDKYVEAMSAAKRASMLGLETHVIYTEKDPKEYTDEEILNFVRV